MLTPIDIQNHTLKIAVRGYSKKETDDFLEEILESYEEIYKENRELKDKLTSLSEGIQYYKNMENTLQKALVLAEKTSSETQEAAKSKADALINEAQAKAEAIQKEAEAFAEITKSNANRELEAARDHVRKLVQSYENYRLQFKKLAESQIEMLENENYSIFAPELAEILEDAPSADEAMEAEETVGMNEEVERANSGELTEEERLADTKDISGIADILESNTTDSDSADSVTKVVDNALNSSDNQEDDEVSDSSSANNDLVAENDAKNTDSVKITQENHDVEDDVVKSDADMADKEEHESEWVNTTPKIEGFDAGESKTVSPETQEEESPFTFIDTE